jgi:hypothetical protein
MYQSLGRALIAAGFIFVEETGQHCKKNLHKTRYRCPVGMLFVWWKMDKYNFFPTNPPFRLTSEWEGFILQDGENLQFLLDFFTMKKDIKPPNDNAIVVANEDFPTVEIPDAIPAERSESSESTQPNDSADPTAESQPKQPAPIPSFSIHRPPSVCFGRRTIL